MTSGCTFDAFLLHFGGRFENRAGLHLRDFREGDAETATAMAEHRILLVQLVHAALQCFDRHAHIFPPARPAAS